jgi:penicillin-binding protein 2
MGGLAQSCDVYFFTMGNELGVNTIGSFARDFGIGALTGIDLPEERTGLLPTPEWKQKTKHMKWLGGDTLNLSIGQGFVTMSPLQMANMVALVANGGVVYKPHVLRETRDPQTGAVVSSVAPEVLHTSALTAEVQEAMRGVITKGTAAPVITTRAVEVAGKTGTAEIGVEGEWHSWFGAYGPYQTADPEERVVVVVMAEASSSWEWWAPKATNLIFQAIFARQTFEEAVAAVKPWYSDAIRRTD